MFSTLKSLRKNRILNFLQWGKLFSAVASSVSSANFDVTLLLVLLRNICGLSPPARACSWDNLLPDSDNRTEANIARIKCYRNDVYGHATKASVDNATFNVLWQKISNFLTEARLLSNGRPVAWGALVASVGDQSFVQGARTGA